MSDIKVSGRYPSAARAPLLISFASLSCPLARPRCGGTWPRFIQSLPRVVHLNRSPGPLPSPPFPSPPLCNGSSSSSGTNTGGSTESSSGGGGGRREGGGGGEGGGSGSDANDNVINVNDKRPAWLHPSARARAPASRAKGARAVGARGTRDS